MYSISLEFTHPYLLLLLLPFLALTVLPYFRLSKKYRKTRNRITSMALHGVLSTLAVLLLAGTTFISSKTNPDNELIILVDVSNTENQVEDQRDRFVKDLINQCSYSGLKVGIVTFGYDQEYVVELTNEYDGLYSKYKEGTLPDISATNIAAAINYTKDLFTNYDSGKIVLISDGKETDENAKTVIKATVASGLKVDTVYVPSSYDGDEIEIRSVQFPEYHINKGEEFTLSVTLHSNYDQEVTIQLYDNGVTTDVDEVTETLTEGDQTLNFKHIFANDGIHELTFKIVGLNDTVIENNEYITYMNVESFNKILILEQNPGESNLLKAILTENEEFTVDVLNVLTDELPSSALALCAYDEVVLNNIANDDLESSFVSSLHEYVRTYGGGLFTTGGSDQNDNSISHAYNREDMVGSLLQQMLPVQVINYTPPVGVIFIIDRSGSMNDEAEDGSTLLEWAKAGTASCLSSLTERDYMGIMSLGTDYGMILEVTPRTQEAKIRSAINSIDTADGSTTYSGAIERAGQILRAMKSVDKKHIVIISDGEVTEGSPDIYEEFARNYYETDGITISVVGVSMSTPLDAAQYINETDVENIPWTNAYYKMLRLTKIAHGRLYPVPISDIDDVLVYQMREDLKAPDIKEVSDKPFYPVIVNNTASVFNGVERLNDEDHGNTMTMQIEGFYGTKIRDGATLLLTGEYNVPLYAQWKYGNGMVGSFMSDVYGLYTSDFLTDQNGITFLKNVVKNLTPIENIRDNEIKLTLYEDNYSNQMSILTGLNEGEYLVGTIKYHDSELGNVEVSMNPIELEEEPTKEQIRNSRVYVQNPMSEANNYSRCKFIIRKPGTYTIEISKYNSEGTLVGSNTISKTLAYSKEYEVFSEEEADPKDLLMTLSKNGNGIYVSDLNDAVSIIDSFDTIIYKKFDPRYLFSIIIIVLFLLDVAVRKFKFKWPHEIIRKYREKKMEGDK